MKAAQVLADRALSQPEREPDLVLAAACFEAEPYDVKHRPYGYPHSCHGVAPERVPGRIAGSGWGPAVRISAMPITQFG